ncbi:MAG TPA: DUF1003 domain-containing protein [Actinomycetes bacterium]|jgi:uncharacterized membrane protein|nr:DUF1003 domain-containing protein [Actinomycetes bacterium]
MPRRIRRRHTSLTAPRRPTPRFALYYDPEAFGRFSEAIARFLGTARYLVFQTVVVIGWIAYNGIMQHLYHRSFDPYPFILLTLALSLQASYAAPLILLAQNRQEERDRQEMLADRRANARTLADTEYLARELAAIRLALGEMPTRDYLGEELDRIEREVNELRAHLDSGREAGRAATEG